MSDTEKDPDVVNGDPGENNEEDEKKKRVYKDFGHETDGPTSPCLCLPGFGVIDNYFQRLWSIWAQFVSL